MTKKNCRKAVNKAFFKKRSKIKCRRPGFVRQKIYFRHSPKGFPQRLPAKALRLRKRPQDAFKTRSSSKSRMKEQKKTVDNPVKFMYSNTCPSGRRRAAYRCDSGVVGNARPCQGRDRGFEPRLSLSLLRKKSSKYGASSFFLRPGTDYREYSGNTGGFRANS